MRRKDREMSKEFALSILDKCEWAVMSMVTPDNTPYCIPVSIVRDEDLIFFHTAKSGKKIELLHENQKVCLSCVGNTNLVPDKYTTEYESAVVFGTASEVEIDEEKIAALKLICERYAASNMAAFDQSIDKSLNRTGVWKIKIDGITGKRKKYGHDGQELKFGKMEE